MSKVPMVERNMNSIARQHEEPDNFEVAVFVRVTPAILELLKKQV